MLALAVASTIVVYDVSALKSEVKEVEKRTNAAIKDSEVRTNAAINDSEVRTNAAIDALGVQVKEMRAELMAAFEKTQSR